MASFEDADAVKQLIEDAGFFADPLDDLVERADEDPGAPFTPEMLSLLDTLKREDRPRFERLRAALKAAGCRVTALDNALRDMSPDGSERETQADRIVSLAASANLFRADDETAFADVMRDGVRQTWPVRSPGFRAWLIRLYHEDTARVPNSEAIGAALNLIEANARYAGKVLPVCVRTARHDRCIYIDLGDDTWRAIEIDLQGWRIIDAPPVRFRRSRGTNALPEPVAGGSIERLRPFLNVRHEDDFVLAVAWLVAALSPDGPFPLLVLTGEQGTAKSTFTRLMACLTDPRRPPLRSLPKDDRDLFIAARNAQVLAFDNISSLAPWLSDALCRLSTGGGFATRKLHTDDDEALFDAMRPVILNGIEDFLSRPDLADRALALELEVIREVRAERAIWAEFDKVRPAILGALCDAVSTGLRRAGETALDDLPRMADFATWMSACEPAFWPQGTFMAAYASSRGQLVEAVIQGDPVASAVRRLAEDEGDWEGNATELLAQLNVMVDAGARGKHWPATAKAMSNRLRRATTFLRRVSVSVSYRLATDRKRTRLIRITQLNDTGRRTASASSAGSASSNATDDADGADDDNP